VEYRQLKVELAEEIEQVGYLLVAIGMFSLKLLAVWCRQRIRKRELVVMSEAALCALLTRQPHA